ncbi:uncharacterized protein LOC116118327 [Pistacia vera]|uniref:uncharacterized protein LOC116118327 n=1 Tax=Pistacia vera TaxID=55513 RepID=UPI0012636086|nr:uncharacterized protein LOC116118327 [Pistacia vera]
MQVLNLRREFKVLRMQEAESIKEYVDILMNIFNKINLLGEELIDKRIIEKVLVSLPERFESKISSLEDSKDLSHISLLGLVHALQAQVQRRLLRQEDNIEGALMASHKVKPYEGGNKKQAGEKKGKEKNDNQGMKSCKQFGHIEKVCKNKSNQQGEQAQLVENHQQQNQETDHLFVAFRYVASGCTEAWLTDNGCTNHMTPDPSNFVDLDHTYKSKVKIGNGELIDVKGRGVVAVQTSTGTKYISKGYLDEEIYVEQLQGFTVEGSEDKVYMLKKALYGLKQAPKAWYSIINEHLGSLGFNRSPNEHTLYVKKIGGDLMIVSLYVDDLFVTGSSLDQLN